MAAAGGGVAVTAKKDDKKDKDDKYVAKEKIKDWSELKKLVKDWQQQFRDQSTEFRSLVDEARKRELKLSECRQQLAAFKRRVLAAEHTQKVVDEKINKIQVRLSNQHTELDSQPTRFFSKTTRKYLKSWICCRRN
jgi:predicted nuclease with TOPRIM domain